MSRTVGVIAHIFKLSQTPPVKCIGYCSANSCMVLVIIGSLNLYMAPIKEKDPPKGGQKKDEGTPAQESKE